MKSTKVLCCLTFISIFAFTCGVKIQCRYQVGEWFFGTFYTCEATITSVENPTNVTEISGIHMGGQNDGSVKGFFINGHRALTGIPDGIEKFFPNLEAFQWFQGNLSSVGSSTFRPFPNLLSINVGDNQLVTLEGDLFQYTRKLKGIYFYVNSLAHIGHGLLTGLNNLTEAIFTANPCINAFAITPEQIQALNLQLPISCPPLNSTVTTTQPGTAPTVTTTPTPTVTIPTTTISTTTAPDTCPVSCSNKTNASEQRMVAMNAEMEQRLTRKIEELDRQIKELTLSPCACKSQ